MFISVLSTCPFFNLTFYSFPRQLYSIIELSHFFTNDSILIPPIGFLKTLYPYFQLRGFSHCIFHRYLKILCKTEPGKSCCCYCYFLWFSPPFFFFLYLLFFLLLHSLETPIECEYYNVSGSKHS